MGITDPALLHIAMALRDGLQAGRADDPMYGEGLSLALAVHVLRAYGGIAAGLQNAQGGLSRAKLMRAIEYIQDTLETGLTVAAIARTVHMSPYHFARLFKQSTGKSPYGYVIQARAKKAKELLTSGKFSIIEIAHRLGFADQSHLTPQLKRTFGVTPKMLQAR
jgi:AraC family transcriptional regulator